MRRSELAGPRPARENRGRQEQAARFLAHGHFAHLHRAAEIAQFLLQQFSDAERRHAHRINGQDQEAAVGVEELAAVGQQRRQIFFEPPHFALGPAAELGRVEQGKDNAKLSSLDHRPIRWIVDDASKFTAREVRRGRRYDGILLDPPKFGRGPEGEVWRLEENLAPLLADCRKLVDAKSRFVVLTVYAVRMSALAIGELMKQMFGDLGGTVEMGEMAVREEARGLLLPTAIFARWSKD